jgi:hypothetical protein
MYVEQVFLGTRSDGGNIVEVYRYVERMPDNSLRTFFVEWRHHQVPYSHISGGIVWMYEMEVASEVHLKECPRIDAPATSQ